jgi:hypothetical protein
MNRHGGIALYIPASVLCGSLYCIVAIPGKPGYLQSMTKRKIIGERWGSDAKNTIEAKVKNAKV